MEIILLDNDFNSLGSAVKDFSKTLLSLQKLQPEKYTEARITECLRIATSIKCVQDFNYSPTIRKNNSVKKHNTFAKSINNQATTGMMQVQSYSQGGVSILWVAELTGCCHGGERLLAYAINMAITNKIDEIKLVPANHSEYLMDFYYGMVNSSFLVYPITCNEENKEIVYRLKK